jgi:hypothetical protein
VVMCRRRATPSSATTTTGSSSPTSVRRPSGHPHVLASAPNSGEWQRNTLGGAESLAGTGAVHCVPLVCSTTATVLRVHNHHDMRRHRTHPVRDMAHDRLMAVLLAVLCTRHSTPWGVAPILYCHPIFMYIHNRIASTAVRSYGSGCVRSLPEVVNGACHILSKKGALWLCGARV